MHPVVHIKHLGVILDCPISLTSHSKGSNYFSASVIPTSYVLIPKLSYVQIDPVSGEAGNREQLLVVENTYS